MEFITSKKILILVFCVISKISIGQNLSSKKTSTKSYEALKESIEAENDDLLKEVNINLLLNKAKNEDNYIEMAEAYKYRCFIYFPDSLCLKYADSIILLTKDLKNFNYPALGYNIKGATLFEYGDSKNALDQYLYGIKYAKENKNYQLLSTLKFNVGLLKNYIGERKEAQEIFKKYLNNIESIKNDFSDNYAKGLYALADSYIYSQKQDSAEIFVKKGIAYSLKKQDSIHYSYFVLASGINSYFNGNYLRSIDSLNKSKVLLIANQNEEFRIALSHYYKGKSLYELNKNKNAILQFKKVDSILNKNNDVTTELLDSYNYLIDDAKRNNRLDLQVKYINSLIKFDSINDKNYKYVKNKLFKDYERTELLSERKELIGKLTKNEKLSNNRIQLLLLIVLFLFLTSAFIIRRNLIYRRRFKSVLETSENKEAILKEKTKMYDSKFDDLPKEISKEIIFALGKFEKSQNFIKKHYTLPSLAKELNTNSSYLSKVVNATKNMNFSNYLNSLKIDYAIERLSNDKKFRSYTIKAISEECGFNTPQSFSVAFNKKTGLFPSYFIKQLNKEKLI